jgi:hypothetical protein
MTNISTNQTEVVRFAGALYGLVLDNATMTDVISAVNASSLDTVLNNVFMSDFGSATNASVASTLVTNLGLTGTAATEAQAYIVGVLGGTAANAMGAAIMTILNQFAGLTSDATFGAAATAWENKVTNGLIYSQSTTNTTNASIGSISSAAPVTTYTLTSGIDHITPAGNSVVNGTLSSTAGASTLTALDSIVATGTGNTLNINDVSGAQAIPAVTVSGIQTANWSSAGASGTGDVSGWTGLSSLTVTELGGAAGITAASTTNVSLTDTAAAATSITINGGANDTVNASGVTGAGTYTVGSATNKAAGVVNVTETVKSTAATATAAAITVNGGTTDTVTANLTGALTATITGGTIAVNGGASTTSVTVNQTAPSGQAAAVPAVAGVAQTASAVAASPGTQKVSAATAVQVVAAAAATPGVADGAVQITDANATSGTAANTIATVSVSNYASGSYVHSNALTSLSLSGNSGANSTFVITNAATTPTNTTLSLTLNGEGAGATATAAGTVATITDTNAEIKTLNVTTAGADSTIVFTDSGLTTLNVTGTNTLNLSTLGGATIGTITVGGSAGFNDNGLLAGEGASLKSFTTTSSGTITATLDDTTQTFVGSTGQDVITISADATKVITGGSATNNELVMNNTAATFNATSAHLTNTNVTGFSVLGLTNSATGAWDMSTLNSTFNAIDDQATSAATSVIKAAKGTSLNIANSDTGTISLAYADTTGASDTTNLTIAESANAGHTSAVPTVAASVTLADANAVGVATVNLVSNGADTDVTTAAAAAPWHGTPTVAGAYNQITTLVDNGLANLKVTGGAGLYVGTLNEASTQATAVTINSSETGILGTIFDTVTDSALGSLTFTGSNSTDIGNLVVSGGTVTTISMSNTGTGAVTIGDGTAFVDAILTTLTLSGNINLTTGSLASTGGVTISGGTDNAHVTVSLAGAASGKTDTITLGNANDSITDGSLAGTVKITTGTGSNAISLGAASTDTTAVYSVTLGSHTSTTGIDQISIGAAGTAFATTPNLTVTGAVTGDKIVFLNDAAQATTVLTAVTAGATAAATITSVESAAAAAHGDVAYSVFGGNTYMAENNVGAAASGTNTTLVEIIGSHTFTAGTGNVVLAS